MLLSGQMLPELLSISSIFRFVFFNFRFPATIFFSLHCWSFQSLIWWIPELGFPVLCYMGGLSPDHLLGQTPQDTCIPGITAAFAFLGNFGASKFHMNRKYTAALIFHALYQAAA